MKKLLLFGALALFGAMNAQTEKGSWVIGGSTTLGFTTATSKYKYQGESADGPKVSSISVTPSVGYFVANNIAIGLDLGISSVTQKNEEDLYSEKNTTTTIAVMPTASYYFKSASNIIPYLGVGVGYASSNNKNTYTENGNTNTDEGKVSGFAYKAKGGVVFLLNQNVGIDVGLSYMGTNGKLDSNKDVKVNTGTFGVNAGVSVFFK
ncbi:OmpW family outer membrane protein [Soonwooa sp.]|uniref:OmpW family outer membrane protein n=1 Tax=Soonwooa sp. TaxID=1938592 RepID=UPI00260D0555|nr:OmpW family outer membrane protein [Soonwooa sp.]